MLHKKEMEKVNCMRLGYIAILLILVFFIVSCGNEETPEDQVKQFVGRRRDS